VGIAGLDAGGAAQATKKAATKGRIKKNNLISLLQFNK
jgi:hypothetical protein